MEARRCLQVPGRFTTDTDGNVTFTIADADAVAFFGTDQAVYAEDNTNTVLFIDVDGNGDWDSAVDSAIVLAGITTLATGDVVF